MSFCPKQKGLVSTDHGVKDGHSRGVKIPKPPGSFQLQGSESCQLKDQNSQSKTKRSLVSCTRRRISILRALGPRDGQTAEDSSPHGGLQSLAPRVQWLPAHNSGASAGRH